MSKTRQMNPSPEAIRPASILVVDDEEGPRRSLQILFGSEHHVHLARDGREGLDIVREHPIELAILDIRMPGMSGTELLAEIKRHDPMIEVIMLTAYETLDSARQALSHGAFEYLNKPFEVDTMRETVRRALGKREQAARLTDGIQQLESMTRELDELRLRQEIEKDKDMIYASIMHDINGPLSIISGYAQLLQAALARNADPGGSQVNTIKSNVDQINEQAQRCIDITQRYLGFLRGEHGAGGSMSANQILSDLDELMQRHQAKGESKLSVERLDTDARLPANATDVMQVLLNLTINALQASDAPHQVRVSPQLLGRGLDLSAYPDSSQCVFINRGGFANSPPLLALSVSDDGPGVPPEIFGRIFEPYFTSKDERRGTGLGLAIVSRLVERAGGGLLVESAPGEGATFTVFLPDAG